MVIAAGQGVMEMGRSRYIKNRLWNLSQKKKKGLSDGLKMTDREEECMTSGFWT